MLKTKLFKKIYINVDHQKYNCDYLKLIVDQNINPHLYIKKDQDKIKKLFFY